MRQLARTGIGPVQLGNLRPGAVRHLSRGELAALYKAVELSPARGDRYPARVSQDGSRAFDGVVALDGPSGTGKSSAARLLARRLGSRYLDTGAMYRAATVAALHADVDRNPEAIARTVAAADIVISTDPEPGRGTARRCGREPGDSLGRRDASCQARIAAVPAVRTGWWPSSASSSGRVGSSWRAGTSAAPSGRRPTQGVSHRQPARTGSSGGPGNATHGRVAQSLHRRDHLDSSRSASPLRRADEAIEIDTTELTLEEVVQALAALVDQPAWDHPRNSLTEGSLRAFAGMADTAGHQCGQCPIPVVRLKVDQ